MSVFLLVLGLFLFLMLIVLHELGHFFVARRNGVHPEEFGIFLPPKVWSRKTKKGWIFSINLLPLGGFVRLKGEYDSDTSEGSYGAASLKAKSKIILAGVGMNLLIAFILFMVLAWIGMPQLVNNQFTVKRDTHYIQQANNTVVVGTVESGSPAAQAGLKDNDTLLALGPKGHVQSLASADNLPNLTKQYAGQQIEIEYKDGNQQHTKTVTLRTAAQIAAAAKAGKQEGYLGVVTGDEQTSIALTRSTWSAPIVAGGIMVQFTALSLHGIGTALHGLGSIIAAAVTNNHSAREAGQTTASSQVAGPVGIYAILKDGTSLGYRFTLMVIAVISFTLALINVLPYPLLDGGKLYMLLIARLFGKKLSKNLETWAYGISFVLLLPLFVLITISDVHRFF